MYSSLAPGAQQTSKILSWGVTFRASTQRIEPSSRPYINPFEINFLLFYKIINLQFLNWLEEKKQIENF
jgi:hypothetical protein